MKTWSTLAGWQAPPGWVKLSTLDMHTGGEPLRVITGGLPPLAGRSVLEKRSFFREHYDHIRTGLMWEPRGHADMYGAVVTPSDTADLDVFFLHNEGYSTMCGHAIIALTTLAYRTGLIDVSSGSGRISFNVPAGRIEATVETEDGELTRASFRNVPSFLYLRDKSVEVPGVGPVRFDVAYGGAFYAFVDADALDLALAPEGYNQLIDYGRRIKRAVMAEFPIDHPFEKALSFLYGTIFTGRAHNPAHHSRNVCIFAEGEVDRSPTGSGVSARAALHHAKGELPLGTTVTVESILGTTMTVQAVERTTYGPYDAVVPEVSGTAFITGRNEFWFDPDDPLASGFILR